LTRQNWNLDAMSEEKTEEATEHKLEQAREEGQLAKSQDAAMAASTLAVVATLLFLGEGLGQRMRAIVGEALDIQVGDLALDTIYKRMASMALEAAMAIAPFVVAAALGAILGLAAHVGLKVSPKAVQIKFDNLNPAQGIKKVFSLKSLLTLAQLLLKAVAIGIVMWQLVLYLLPLISGAVYQSTESIGVISWRAVTKMLVFGVLLFVVLAPLDYALQRYLFMKGQRMSKDETKREHKGLEGDPDIKDKRKQLAREFAQEAPKRAVARADALIVNPTHYAVAIRYRPDEGGVPIVLAKGVDEAAMILRGFAEAQGVPIFAHPPLARALHEVLVDRPIPEELFEPVAAVLRWVNDIGAQRPAAGMPPSSP
jgi:type III secretion protein U